MKLPLTRRPKAEPRQKVAVVALMAVRNERRFLAANLAHLAAHGVGAYIIDNGSTDGTYEIAEANEAGAVVGLERIPYDGTFRWIRLLERKEELATELEADWFMHLDADEFRVPPGGIGMLAEAFGMVEASGYNAVNFIEFTFVPTIEEPDHDRPEFTDTMRWYYPFRPFSPHQLKAWKRQPGQGRAGGGGWSPGGLPGDQTRPRTLPDAALYVPEPRPRRREVRRANLRSQRARHGLARAARPADRGRLAVIFSE